MAKNLILCGRNKDGKSIFYERDQIINNALKQEAEGIAPHYVFYDYEKREAVTPAGWLVVSLWHGCIIVYRNESGRMVICPGVQGDFAYI